MARKIQVPAIGGLRKVIRTSDDRAQALNPGTTIAEFSNQTITLAQLKAALGLTPQITKPSPGSGTTGSIVPGPGLGGGGPIVGAVPLYLTAPVPVFIEDADGGDSEPGPPGQRGVDGATGAGGPVGPAVFMSAADGEDGADGIPGPQGPQGNPGVSGSNGPAVFMSAADGEDGADGIPGPPGPQGNPGVTGFPGPAVFMLSDDGADGEPGPPGVSSASSASVSGLVFIGEDVALSNTSNLTVSSLDLNTDGQYLLQIGLLGASSGIATLNLYFSGDTTDANYKRALISGGGTAVTGNNAAFGGLPNSSGANWQGWVASNPLGRPTFNHQGCRTESSTITVQSGAVVWNTAANVTSITVNSSVSNQIVTGSYLRVWKLVAA